ncbi:(deoxy)nucleoside triphosphate pyrophosphohydrolase [Flavobacterium sp.]|uniref:(deoxy)nucleoside triphosphate pyrophosphohydrolase n=1 Tax=Flavobacterium sp. TaxID=239 RepID=UPI00262B9D70|nr:(deoxy)nucleoside triphosphate pyrophosphohydrolase [Flavobacterium sp.]
MVYPVICAIIHFGDRVLAVQRSESMSLPLKWEFPGGKLEDNETEEECIIREIKEELNINIEVLQRLSPVLHSYPNISIELIPYSSKYLSGELLLKEHKQYVLLEIEELCQLDWAEADVPILNQLKNL